MSKMLWAAIASVLRLVLPYSDSATTRLYLRVLLVIGFLLIYQGFNMFSTIRKIRFVLLANPFMLSIRNIKIYVTIGMIVIECNMSREIHMSIRWAYALEIYYS